MKRNKILFLLFAAMACTFCIAISEAAGEPVKTMADELTTPAMDYGFAGMTISRGRNGELHVPARSGAWEQTRNTRAAEQDISMRHRTDVFRVLAVLEQRMDDRRLIDKVKYKLSTMSGKRLHLAVSLSEQAADNGPGVKADIAFLLLTTLIVFS